MVYVEILAVAWVVKAALACSKASEDHLLKNCKWMFERQGRFWIFYSHGREGDEITVVSHVDAVCCLMQLEKCGKLIQ